MRPQKIEEQEMLNGFAKLFKEKGYEGTSLAELALVTGLKKASLYHRFPQGKEEMAKAVLLNINNWVEEHVFNTLTNQLLSPAERLKNGLQFIKKLYEEGNAPCLLQAFSMQSGINIFSQLINDSMSYWVDAFTNIGLAFGLNQSVAKEKATQVLIEIQGSLIVSRGFNNPKIFINTLNNIETLYTKE
ncbi:TetR/AcrR family transcriptional regulator [Reichenbachiella agarivorans]|uniref:TetR/AcrR family transcriptional regulator n=1 Tax=Reichenbachiella agarivorans TaxID=2979464 RepID=A0ABY6CMH0_9BACT|nr:TetR/AcrR family transcriptional regulator [Reichenbachiella agarivorans]UXP30944.1 TetR/AcrR family transcriptional regulator [Reichenbachiella agarivorans]